MGRQQPERREGVGHVGGGGELALVGRGLPDVARREAIDDEGRDAGPHQSLGPRLLPLADPRPP
jgi:hypothetical protein